MNITTMEVLRTTAVQAPKTRPALEREHAGSDTIRHWGEISGRSLVRHSLQDWVTSALRDLGQQPTAHHRLLLEELECLSRGKTDRLMILMPPGSAKSTYVSILLPAWWFTQHPHSSIIATTHTAQLAEYFARRTRRIIAEHTSRLGYSIAPDTRADASWTTTSGGEYYAVGVRGSVIGRRADLAIIDDPIRSRADADSQTLRNGIWDWYRSDLTTRLKPNARVVLVMTRWHEDDIGGRLLDQVPAEWRVLKLPALAEETDPLGRSVEGPLWPEWENDSALQRKRALLGERAWLALFQQTPRPNTGSLFDVDRLAFIDTPPERASGTVIRAWDLAASVAVSGTDPDWTVGVKVTCDEVGRCTVLDVIRMRGSPRQVEESIITAARCDGSKVKISLPEDPGQAGKGQVAYLTARLAGYHVTSSRETGAKETRAAPAASQVEAGNVAIVRAAWNHAFIEELRDFPFGRKDDQVDAFARAFLELTRVGTPARSISLPLIGR
jgi:predicted phage terminase large subunit-like protein